MNILFITADQWRGECLSATGHPIVKTPHLDALAADGLAFKHHYGQATPCGPSRVCLYTGMYLHNHRSLLNGTPLDSRHTNVALEARKIGYQPVLFGYTDVGLDPRNQDIVDDYEGVLPGMDAICHLNSKRVPWLAYLEQQGYAFTQKSQHVFAQQENYPDAENKGQTYAPTIFKAEDSPAAFLIDEAIEYINIQQDKPWFAHVSFLSPHPPFVAPEPYHAMFNADDMPLPIRHETWQKEAEQHPWLDYYLNHKSAAAGFTTQPEICERRDLPDQELRQMRATYYGMMAEVDAQIGRLVAHLKQTNTYDDTLIIFTSDHGENMGDHHAHSKYTYFEETFHVPLIIRDPSKTANSTRGKIIKAFTEAVDLMPTMLDFIGLDIPHQCDGESLLGFGRDVQPNEWRTEAHMEFDMRAPYDGKGKPPLGLKMNQCMVNIIRDDQYKYVHFTTLPPLLFDLQKDPDEFNNLANDPEYKTVMIKYASKLLSWRMENDDRALTDMRLTAEGGVENGMRAL